MLGVSRQRVHQLTARADFPDPVVVLAGGNIWERRAISDWIEARGRALDTDET